MPIRRDLRKFYGPEWRNETRPRILARAGGRFNKQGKYVGGARCERCRKPDRRKVLTVTGLKTPPFMIWKRKRSGGWFDECGQSVTRDETMEPAREIRVRVGVAHLNHKAGDDRDDNLAALCDWCHLHYDCKVHVQTARETRRDRKDAARLLLQEALC